MSCRTSPTKAWLKRCVTLAGAFAAQRTESQLLSNSSGLVSRSRWLRCAGEVERVLRSMDRKTIESAQVFGINELGKMGVAARTADFLKDTLFHTFNVTGLRREMLDICWRDHCVAFFSAAGKDLLVAIAAPHDIPKDAEETKANEAEGIKHVRTLGLFRESVVPSQQAEPLYDMYEVYCIKNGVDKLRRRDSFQLRTFILETLRSHQKQATLPATPHIALDRAYFDAKRILKVDGRHRFLAAEDRDWRMLERLFVDYRHGQEGIRSDLVDLKLPQTWASDANVAVLIGGESGSGKTMEMICGHCDKSDLVIYIRGFPGESGVVGAIQLAFFCSCPLMDDVLKRHNNGDKFTVRLCFDVMGNSSAFSSLCSMDLIKLRELLGWGVLVEIRVAAAGSGIVAACTAGGIKSNLYQLSVLTHSESTRNASVYWRIRRHLITDAMKVCCSEMFVRLGELLSDVEMLEKYWGDRTQREALLTQRSATLSRLLQEYPKLLAEKTAPYSARLTVPRSISTLLARKIIFAAVESDGACAAALSNPRMAVLFIIAVHNNARDTLSDDISVTKGGFNVRRHVLQRAALVFKQISMMDRDTPREISARFVEALRYVLFDGYASADTHSADSLHKASQLAAQQGIMIDNATFEKVVPKGCAVVLGDDNKPRTMTIKSSDSEPGVVYTACYPKDVGRYSISPAMVVVLTTLMTGAFEENFSNISGGFEHSVAKFLYLAVQAFHGRPVRELVDFIVGPSAVVGETAKKVLDSNTMINFRSLTLRTGVTMLREHDGAKDSGAWIEIRPLLLGKVDVVLHIPNTVTITIGCTTAFGDSFEQRERSGIGWNESTRELSGDAASHDDAVMKKMRLHRARASMMLFDVDKEPCCGMDLTATLTPV